MYKIYSLVNPDFIGDSRPLMWGNTQIFIRAVKIMKGAILRSN